MRNNKLKQIKNKIQNGFFQNTPIKIPKKYTKIKIPKINTQK